MTAIAALIPATPASARGYRSPDLTVATLDGDLRAAQNEILFQPYAKMRHLSLRTATWDDALATLRNRNGSRQRPWSLALVEDSTVQLGCTQHLFMPVATDPSDGKCGTPALLLDLGVAWDKSRLSSPPDWQGFWDIARHPGKRGMRCDPRTTLEAALLSDGVAPADLYRVLATKEGQDRAFRRLDQLRPYIAWWSTPAEAARILTSGSALMSIVPTGEIVAANRAAKTDKFGILWDGRLRDQYDWALLPSTPQTAAMAGAFVDWMSETEQTSQFNARYSPGSDSPGVIPIDNAFWHDHLEAIATRFDLWLSSR